MRFPTVYVAIRYVEPGGDYSKLDIIMHTFPYYQRIYMVRLINLNLYSEIINNNIPTTPCKLLKWIDVLIMETHVECETLA